MSRLRIFSGGTGNLQYDSRGTSRNVQDDRARREFNAGVLLFYVPEQDQLHSYVKIHRNAQEQFLAVYEDESGDLVQNFKSEIEAAVEERGWRLVSAADVNQAVFERLGTEETTTPNVGREEIASELNSVGKVDFVAGDGHSAVDLFEYLRQEFPDRSIAITMSGRGDPVENASLVIKIEETYSHAQPSVAGETAKRLHDAQVESDKDALRAQLDGIVSASGISSKTVLGRKLAAELESRGIRDRFGLAARAHSAPSVGREQIMRYGLSLFGLVAVATVLYVVTVILRGPNAYLTLEVAVWVPFVDPPLFVASSWQVLLLGTAVVVGVLLSVRGFRQLLGYGIPSVGLFDALASLTGGRRGSRRRGNEAGRKLVEQLSQLESRTASEKRFVKEAKDVFSAYGVQLTREQVVSKNRNRRRLVGAGLGLLAGLLLVSSVFVALPRILGFLTAHWLTLLDVVLGTAVVAVVVRPVYGLVSSRSRETVEYQRRRSRSSPTRQSTNARSAGRSPRSSQRSGNRSRSGQHRRSPHPATKSSAPSRGNTSSGTSRQSAPDPNRPSTESGASDSGWNASGEPPADETSISGTPDDDSEEEPQRPGAKFDPTSAGSTVDIDAGGESGVDPSDERPDLTASNDAGGESDIDPPDEELDPAGPGDAGTEPTSPARVDADDSSTSHSSPQDETGGSGVSSLEYEGMAVEPHQPDAFRRGRYDIVNTGHHPEVTDHIGDDGPEQRWVRRPRGATFTQPVTAGGTLFVGRSDGKVYAFNAITQRGKQFVGLKGTFESCPALTKTAVLVGSREGTLYSLDRETLEQNWKRTFDGGLTASPVVVSDSIFVVTDDGTVEVLDSTSGEPKEEYSYAISATVASTPAVTESAAYLGTTDDQLVASQHQHGVSWTYPLPGRLTAPPTFVDDEVYIGVPSKSRVDAVDATTGEARWQVETRGAVEGAPAVAGDSLFIGDLDGSFYAIDRTGGESQWTTSVGTPIATPATVAGGHVYVGDQSGQLHALDARTGEEIWCYDDATGAVRGAPVVVDGSVFFATDSGELHALGDRTPSTRLG